MTHAFLHIGAQQALDYICISVAYFKLCCYAEFYCKSRLPDKLVLVITHLQTVVTLWAVHWEHTLAASMSSRQMTRHTANVLGNSWPLTNPLSMQQRMHWKIFSICILVAGLDIRFLCCSAWEHCEHREAEDERSEKRSAKWYEVEIERGKFEGLSW